MSSPSFRRVEQCDRCLNNTRNPHLPCAVRPYGVTEGEERCADFEADPSVPVEEQWEPEGASFYNGELVINPVQRWTQAQKLELLLWHPLFTRRCPQCRHEFVPDAERVHWDCAECGWVDDTV